MDVATSKTIVFASLLGVSAAASLPSAAFARDHWGHRYSEEYYQDGDWRDHRGYRDSYEDPHYYRERPRYVNRPRYRCRSGGTTGAIVGGALGALLGRGVDRSGDRAVGTILGAGGGALIGREIERNRHC
ncbi:glycine zipper 2TM domain-containing protein [Novosphingobium sp. G106]|uniref:glycine zipper 2TM domain-containing protein n=1 Tax=Novosphingobium sp. G106 TaxID=2849500 RepID=UPI001C2D4ECD|nr:glycine zipper 2TM domain-containing protein [Novosphingobium sp. G106]MBV1692445.1 glycine zipper 2TM domain-containing protein [Novosphingobium sp. G106]